MKAMNMTNSLMITAMASTTLAAGAGPEPSGRVVTDPGQMRPAGHIVIDLSGDHGIAGPTFRYQNNGPRTLAFLPGRSTLEPDRSNWIADDAILIDGGPELDLLSGTV